MKNKTNAQSNFSYHTTDFNSFFRMFTEDGIKSKFS